MRIIAGSLGGRIFNDPPRFGYNPMSEKMRGALFNVLGNIEGLTVLDPFGGTGAISFEAVSRGASLAIALEYDKRAFENIKKNVEILKLNNQVKVIRSNSSGWSDNNKDAKFDLLLMDPPYDNLQLQLIQKLQNRHLKKTGLAVMSYPRRILVAPLFSGLKPVSIKKYGDGNLAFYKKK